MYEETSENMFSWALEADGGIGLLNEMLSGIRSGTDSYLILPTKMMIREAKREVISRGGGETGWIMTPTGLASHLYDRLGGGKPVMDRGFRDMAVRRILKSGDYPNLTLPGIPLGGVVKRISSAISTLVLNRIVPEKLSREGGRESELSGIYKKYIDLCTQSEILDRDMLPGETVKLIEEAGFEADALGIYLPGKLDPAYGELMETLLERSRFKKVIEHVCRKPPSFVEEKEKPDRQVRFSIPDEGDRARQMIYSRDTLEAIIAEDPTRETKEICRYIKEICAEGTDPGEITVVYPDRDPHAKEVKQVFFDYGIPYTTRNDQRVREMPCIVSIFEILQSALEGFPRGKVVRSLSSSYFRIKDKDKKTVQWRELEEATRVSAVFGSGGDIEREWLDPLERFAQETEDEPLAGSVLRVRSSLERILRSLDRLVSEERSYKGHMDELFGTLSILGYEHDSLDEGESLAFDKFLGTLKSIRRRELILGAEEIDFREFLSTLESSLEDVSISMGRGRGVRIMGLGEFTGLSSDIVIFASMTEKEIPFGDKPFTILSDNNRERLNITRMHDRRKTLENLCISLGGVKRPVVTFYRSQGESAVAISPFIEEVPLREIDTGEDPRSHLEALSYVGEYHSSVNPRVTQKDSSRLFERESLLGEEKEIVEKAISGSSLRRSRSHPSHNGTILQPELAEEIRDRFHHDYIWSPSKLEAYRDCPYRFFVENVLRISPVEELEPEVPPDKKGIILHSVLERFYNRMKEEGMFRVEGDSIQEAWETARRCALEVLSSYSFRGPYWDALKDSILGSGDERGILRDFIDFESSYNGPFNVRECELSFGIEEGVRVGGDLTGEGLNLRGFVDRLDSMSVEGREAFFIWDYKTGGLPSIRDSLQVPLYLAAVKRLHPESIPGGGGYYHIARRGGLNRKIALGKKVWEGGIDLDKLRREVSRVRSKIDRKVDEALEIIEGIRSASFPRKEACYNRYCEYSGMCRKGEW